MKVIVEIALLISIAYSKVSIDSSDSHFDPGRITWWKNTWSSSPITTSSDHQGTISLTFNYRVTTAVTLGTIEISGPGITTFIDTELTLAAGEETSVLVSSITVSEVGILGPFKLVTRKAANGQIVDANYSFGSVYIDGALPASSSLTVLDTAASPIGSPAQGATINLSFAFTIDYDMWEHDLIEIDIPLANNVPLVIPPTNPTCKSLDTDPNISDTVVVNNLCEDTAVASCELLCEYEESVDSTTPVNSVYKIIIYGFNKSLNYISTAIEAKISIDGFTLPYMNYAGNEFSWTVRTKRFGTNYVYKEYTGIGSVTITSIAPGNIEVSSFPHRGMSSSKLFNGMSIYMDFVFTTSNVIPTSGYLTATFVGLTMSYFPDDSYTMCVSNIGTCSAPNGQHSLTITAGDSDISAGAIIATVYATFAASAASVVVETKSSESRLIDQLSHSGTITMADISSTTEVKAQDMKIVLADNLSSDSEADTSKGSSEMVFKLGVIPSASITGASSSLYFDCPLDTTSLSKTKLYISNTNVSSVHKAISEINDYGNIDETLDLSNDASDATVIYATNSITIANGSMIDVDSTSIYALASVGMPSSNTVRAPMVTGNKATFYECHGGITTPTETQNIAATFTVIDNDSILSGALLCTADDTQGIPLVITITADSIELADHNYTITLGGSNYFGLGVNADTTATGWKVGGTVAVSITETLMTITDFGIATSGSPLELFVPHGDGQISGDLMILYTINDVNHVVSRVIALTEDNLTTPYDESLTAALTGSNNDIGEYIAINISKLNSQVEGEILGIGKIPPWWDVTSVSFTTDAIGFIVENTGYISSADPQFTGQAVFAIGSGGDLGSDTFDVFAGIKAKSKNEDAMLTYIAKASSSGGSCNGISEIPANTLNLNTVPFTSVTFSPLTSAAKGPGVLAQDIVLTITLSQPVPQGGTITFDLGTFWEVQSYSVCTVANLTDIDSSNTVICVVSGATYTIVNFQEAAAATVVTITITNANPDSSSPVDSGTPNAVCIDRVISYDAINKIINESPSPAVNTCSSTTANPIGQSKFALDAVVYYPNAGTRTADVHMTFSLNYALPSGSTITIVAPGTATASKDTAFANFIYTAVSTSGSTVTFTTGEALDSEETLEFYFDSSVVAGAPGGTGNWQVASAYGGVTYTDDAAITPTANKFTVTNGAPGATINDGTITATVKTPGEYSSYKFIYTTPGAIEAADTFRVVFPTAFDPNIGYSEEHSSGDWRIQCTSTVFTNAVCKVDHWMVLVSSLTNVLALSSVDLTIHFVKNPAFPGHAIVFGWIHMDDDGMTVDAIAESFASFTVETDPGYLDLRSVNISNTQLLESAEYTLLFYVDTSIEASDEFRVMFPMNYNLPLYNGPSVPCSARFADENANIETTSDIDASTLTCTIYGNQVQWAANSALDSTVDLDSHHQVIMTLTELTNPAVGLSRTYSRPFYDLFSTAISESLFTEYSLWSTKFEVSIYDASTTSVTFKSFAHRNSAYLGYGGTLTQHISLQVGNYDAKTMSNWLMVNAGQMSQEYTVAFSNEVPLIADKLNFAGSIDTLGLFIANSTTDWSFNLLDHSLKLRISASIGTAAGIFYITLSAGPETQGICHNSALYGPGPKVMVEVVASTSAISVVTTAIVYNNSSSYLVKVSLPYPPHTNVSVNIDFGTRRNLINTTEAATFYRGDTVKYLTIQASNLPTADYDGIYYLSGTDKAAYTIATKLTVNVKDSTEKPTSIPSISLTKTMVDSNTASIGVAGGGDGIAYVSLKCSQDSAGFTRTRTIDEMKAKLTSAGMTVYDPAIASRSYDTTSNSFYQFLKDVAAEACYTEQYASLSHLSTYTSTFMFDWLMDAQRYLAIAYVESYSVSTNATIEFTTSEPKTLKRYTVFISSVTNVTNTDTNSDTIACQLADSLRVSQHYLYRHTPTSETNIQDSTLIDSTYMFDLMYNRIDAANSPAKFAAFLTDTPGLISNTKTALSLADTKDSISITVADVETGTPPTIGNILPQKTEQTNSAITYTWTPNHSGQWCSLCAAKTDDNEHSTKPDVNSIPYGLSAGYNKSGYLCIDVTKGSSYTAVVSNLSEKTEHYCYHAFCSTDKLFPVCAEISGVENGPFVTGSASILTVFSLILILILN